LCVDQLGYLAVSDLIQNSSSRLIEWCRQTFPNAVFAVYEQIEPDDGFGLVMSQHFDKLSIPLLSLPVYRDKHTQKQRYLDKVLIEKKMQI